MSVAEFRRAVVEHDQDRITALLAEDVVLHSPVTGRPFHGRALVAALLDAARSILENFTYTAELGNDEMACLVFEATVAGKATQGVDLVVTGPDGLVSEFTAILRPLSAVTAFNAAMTPHAAALLGGDR